MNELQAKITDIINEQVVVNPSTAAEHAANDALHRITSSLANYFAGPDFDKDKFYKAAMGDVA